MIKVFSKQWFKKHNNELVKIARLPFFGELVFGFNKMGHYVDRKNIVAIRPNSVVEHIGYKNELPEFREHFFGRNKYAERLRDVFYPIWGTFHLWDMEIANRFAPYLNLGFDTLTVYPDANAIDGYVQRSGSNEQLATIIAGAGTGNKYSTTELFCELQNGYAGNNNNYNSLFRSILLFNTGSLGTDATISGAVLSTYYKAKQNLGGVYIVSSNPASDTALANSDYGNLGTTSFGYLADASISASQYNDFTLNASGLSAISKTSLSKFGMKIDIDFTGTGDGATGNGYDRYYNFYSSRRTGTANDPKLVVTYTLPATTNAIFFGMNF